MLIWETNIPDHLIKKRKIVQTIIFTSVFALAFINIYAPFGVDYWYNVTKVQLFLYSSLVILTGILVVVISRIIMYYHSKRHKITYLQYSLWILAEILSMAAFYTIFIKFILHDTRIITDIFKISVKNTALVLLLPYTILWLYFSWNDKSQKLEQLTFKDSDTTFSKRMIPFRDEKGTLRFSILLDDLLYLESSDNYVTVYYLDHTKVSKFMIRNSLKYYEESLGVTNLVRCHRSYIVNFDKVKIMRKEKEGLLLELDNPQQLSLPVSKTYVASIIEAFSKYTR